MILLLEYAIVATIVVFAAIKASHYIDLIDRTTKLSGAFLGGVLLSAVTSLPEFFTSLSATIFLDKPALCIGNILGSDLFNIAMLSVLVLLAMRSFGTAKIGRGNIIVSLYMILIYGVMLLNYFDIIDVEFATLNIITFIFIGIYALAVRHLASESCDGCSCENEEPITLTLRQIVIRFALTAVVIVVASVILTYITDDIAAKYNLGVGLAGAIFLGVATSLPEVASTIALVRIRNYDIAVGNIVGSNLFNFLVLCTADLFSRGEIYDYSDFNVVKLLFFGTVATIFTVPMLKCKGWVVRSLCAVCIVACYLSFLLLK
jgi:cation:H+ antiporter